MKSDSAVTAVTQLDLHLIQAFSGNDPICISRQIPISCEKSECWVAPGENISANFIVGGGLSNKDVIKRCCGNDRAAKLDCCHWAEQQMEKRAQPELVGDIHISVWVHPASVYSSYMQHSNTSHLLSPPGMNNT